MHQSLKYLIPLFFVSTVSQVNDLCFSSCPSGQPETNIEITRPIYRMSFNGETKFADWVAYKITKESIGPTKPRRWRSDPEIPDGQELEEEDYKGSYDANYTDRGHQVPLASFTSTPHWRLTNILSNITPQKTPLNRGPWNRLEAAVRNVAKKKEAVWVVTGPLYEEDQVSFSLPNADEPHRTPTGYFKVITDGNGNMTAFIFDQDAEWSYDICNARKSIDEVELRSGFQVFASNIEFSGTLDRSLGCAED
jgi:endonuclease G